MNRARSIFPGLSQSPLAARPASGRPAGMDSDEWRVCRATDFSQLNVLVVDEDPMHRMLIHTALDCLGVGNVEEAGAGLTGLQALEQSSRVFDVVISDLKMTSLDDIEFVRLAPKEKFASLILVSGRGLQVLAPAAAICRGYGVNVRGVLAKPIALSHLKVLLSL